MKSTYRKSLFSIIICCLGVTIITSSCEKLLEVDAPATNVDGATVFQSDAGAISVMTGVYARAANPLGGNFSSLSMCTGLSADELTAYGQGIDFFNQLYKNQLTSSFSYFWSELYNYIYSTNEVIEGINGSTMLSKPVSTRLMGEAKFMRAFFYFYLVNLYGNVPLVTSTDYRTNMSMARDSVSKVYVQIIADLKDAEELMGTEYTTSNLVTASADRVRPNKWAAAALLARVYLFTGDMANAITQSSKVIDQTATYRLTSLDSVFLKDGKEAIFQLQSVQNNINTYEGNSFILVAAPNFSNPVSLSDSVYNSFEPGDKRKTSWVGSFTSTGTGAATYYFPYKYKVRSTGSTMIPLTENAVMLRLAEQYLIRAEAYIRSNNIPLGINDLNTLRTRSRLPASGTVPDPLPALSTALSLTDALKAVEHERRTEMFTEMGDRWLTLKRTKGFSNPNISRADEFMPAATSAKGGTWRTEWQLYPIPRTETIKDVNLKQNPEYN